MPKKEPTSENYREAICNRFKQHADEPDACPSGAYPQPVPEGGDEFPAPSTENPASGSQSPVHSAQQLDTDSLIDVPGTQPQVPNVPSSGARLEKTVNKNELKPTKEVILIREPQEDEDEISLSKFLLILKHRWKSIVIPSLVIASLVGVYSYTRPRFYAAQTTLVPPLELMQKTGSLASGLGGLQKSMLSNIMGDTNLSEMYVGILESRNIAEKIIDRFDLKTVYKKQSMADVLKTLNDRTEFKIRKDGIISVQVKDLNPQLASDMANAFVEELDQQNRRLSGGSATSKRKFLETRLTELKQELSSIDQMPANEAKLKETIFETLSQEYELARIEEAKSMPTIQVLDEAVPPEEGIGKGTVKKMTVAGMSTLILIALAVFLLDDLRQGAKRTMPKISERTENIIN